MASLSCSHAFQEQALSPRGFTPAYCAVPLALEKSSVVPLPGAVVVVVLLLLLFRVGRHSLDSLEGSLDAPLQVAGWFTAGAQAKIRVNFLQFDTLPYGSQNVLVD